MTFENSTTFINSYDRVETSFVATNGDRIICHQPINNPVALELIRIGTISPRSLCRNILLPFSTKTIQLLLSQILLDDICNDRQWFQLEVVLEEISGYAIQYPEIQKVRDTICERLFETCDDSNCFLLQRKFAELSCQTFCDKVYEYIKYNLIRMIFNKTIDVTFYRIDAEDLQMLLDEDWLNIEEEEQIIQVIDTWIQARPSEREKFRALLMSSVRGIALQSSLFEEISTNYPLSKKPPRKYCDTLISLGGWMRKCASQDIDWYDTEQTAWRRSNLRLPYPLAYHGVAIANGNLYVFGGSDGSKYRNETWKLDVITGKWIPCDFMHESRNYISNSCVTYDNKIYVFGGQYGREMESPMSRNIRSRSGEYYDSINDKWTPTANMGFMRSDCAVAVYKDQIFITGGFNGSEILRSAEIYNPHGDFFIQIQDLPDLLSSHTMVTHHSKLYILGGFDTQNRQNRILVWENDSHWSVVENEKMLKARSTFTAVSYRGVIVTAGGFTQAADSSCETLLSTRTDPIHIPNLIQRKSCTKLIVAPNFRKIMDNFGTTSIDDLINIEETGESQYEYDDSTINDQA